MKKVMLFIVSMLFAVSASAASLTLTGLSPNAGVTFGFGTGTVVTGAASVSDVAASSSSWGLTTTADTNSVFNIGFAHLNGFSSVTTLLNNATAKLTEIGSGVVVNLGPVSSTGFSFGYLLLAAKAYILDITGDASGFNPTTTQLAVSAVPVPAALFLFAPALLGFFGLRRKATALAA